MKKLALDEYGIERRPTKPGQSKSKNAKRMKGQQVIIDKVTGKMAHRRNWIKKKRREQIEESDEKKECGRGPRGIGEN